MIIIIIVIIIIVIVIVIVIVIILRVCLLKMFDVFLALNARWRVELGKLALRGVPPRMVMLCALVVLAGLVDHHSPLDAVEFFAGKMAITLGLQYRDFNCYAVELLQDKGAGVQDIMTPQGFAFALSLVLRTVPGGMNWWGIVCSTWIWLCRSTTGRSETNVLGNWRKRRNVRVGNEMLARVIALMMVGCARGVLNILEQPDSSIMPLAPRFQQWIAAFAVFVTKVRLGFFGGASEKPVKLFSTDPCVREVPRNPPRSWAPKDGGLWKKYKNEDGETKLDGDTNLKPSQEYPLLFGWAVARMYARNRPRLVATANMQASNTADADAVEALYEALQLQRDCDQWEDANLEPVVELLCSMIDQRFPSPPLSIAIIV